MGFKFQGFWFEVFGVVGFGLQRLSLRFAGFWVSDCFESWGESGVPSVWMTVLDLASTFLGLVFGHQSSSTALGFRCGALQAMRQVEEYVLLGPRVSGAVTNPETPNPGP